MIRAAQSKTMGPPGLPLVGNLFQFRRDPLAFLRHASSYGEIVSIHLLKPTFLVNTSEYARHVLLENARNYTKGPLNRRLRAFLGDGLLTSEGSWWRYQRGVVQPFFNHEHILNLVPLISEIVRRVCDRWEDLAMKGEPVHIHEEMIRITSAVIGNVVLGTVLSADTERLASAVTAGLRAAQRRAGSFFPVPMWIPTPSNLHGRHALKMLTDIVEQHINLRKMNPTEKRSDLLAGLLDSRNDQGKAMSHQQLINQLITVLIAGYETSATALSWLWYLVALHPKVQKKMREEVTSSLGDHSEMTGLEQLNRLRYSAAAFQEALRLYPPSWLLHREAIREDMIGRIKILPGTAVLVSPYLLHRHPAYWSEVDQFKPVRFMTESGPPRPKFCFIPFGGGARYCIGSQLALLEAQIVVSHILQRFEVYRWNHTSIRPEAAVTLRPNQPILLGIRKVGREI